MFYDNVKAAPITTIKRYLKEAEIVNCSDILFKTEFKVTGFFSNNHVENILIFTKLLTIFEGDKGKRKNDISSI